MLKWLGVLTALLLFAIPGAAQVTCPAAPCAAGPLTQSANNSRYWVRPDTGKPIFLDGDYSWNLLTDYGTNGSPTAINFTNFVTFAQSHGINAVILWKKDLPTLFQWQLGVNWTLSPWPWNRTGPGNATDGLPKFDLTSFNTTFDNLIHARCLALYQANIYCIVLLFDGADTTFTRFANDGGPFTSTNNINGIADGYLNSGQVGTGMFTQSAANAITNMEDSWITHIVGVLDDLPNVIYETSEEGPGTSFSGTPGYGGASQLTFWVPHVKTVINTAEASLPLKHPVGIGAMNVNDVNDAGLYASTLNWIEPTINSNFSNQFPANVAINNQGKIVVNDSDHSQDPATLLNANGTVNDPQDRKWIWENITQGAAGVFLLDPYLISLPSTTPVRNTCGGTITNGVCTTVDPKWDNLRNALGYTQKVTSQVDLSLMTPQPSLASTGFALVNASTTNADFIVYQPNTGAFTVNLSGTGMSTQTFAVQWLNPASGVVTYAPSVAGGSATQSFTPPSGTDAVLLLQGQQPYYVPPGLGWQRLSGSAMQPNGEPGGAGDVCPANGFVSGYAFDDRCYNVELAWSSGIMDQANNRMIIWGGGHTDYSGNEVYAMDHSSGAWRMHRATAPSATGSNDALADGRPNSRHTYSGEVYVRHLHLLAQAGGCLADANCTISHKQWTLDLNSIPSSCYAATQSATGCTPTWTDITASQTGTPFANVASGFTDQPLCDYWDKTLATNATNFVYCWYPNGTVPNLLQEDLDSHVNTMLGNGSSQGNHYSGGIEQRSGLFVWGGSGQLGVFDLNNSGLNTSKTVPASCTNAVATTYPGFAYDPVSQHMLIWPGQGQTVYELITGGTAAGTWSCNALTLGSTVPPTSTAGTSGTGVFGRFGYMPSEDAFFMAASNTGAPANTDVYVWRRRIAPDGNTGSSRCATAGVIQCDLMDTTADTVPFFQNSVSGPGNGILDTTSAPPGSSNMGSSMLTIPANVNFADISTNWNRSWPQGFGQGSHFYVQYRFKMDSNFANFNWNAGNGAGHKFSIFHYNGNSCAGVELTTQDQFQRGYPQMYSNCGAVNYDVDLGNGDFLYEQGNPIDGTTVTNTPYNCHRNGATTQSCAVVEFPWTTGQQHPGEWLTLYYDITVGTWGVANSTIKAYFGYQGQPLQQFENWPGNALINCNNAPCNTDPAVFNHYDFLTYVTGWNGGVGNTPQMNVWYSSAIVSTQPIPDPAQTQNFAATPSISPSTGTYSSPQTIMLTDGTAGVTICYTTNGTAPTTNGGGTCVNGTAYSTPFSQALPATIQAIATKAGLVDSGIASVTLSTPAPTPSITPVSGNYTSPQNITITDSLAGATICYTVDGSTPTANGNGTCVNGTTYTGIFSQGLPVVVKAIASKATYADSSAASNNLTTTAATPTFSPTGGSYAGTQTISINTASPGAIICYNTTGAPATNGAAGCTTGTLYTGPILVAISETVYAVAGGTGYVDSGVGSAVYTIGAAPVAPAAIMILVQ